MPPRVHCAEVETSTGYQRPCGFSQALSWSSTTPGCTVTCGLVLVEAHDLAQMLGDVDDQRLAHGLAALRRAGAARHDGGLGVARDVDDQRQVGLVARHHHTHRLDLVDRGVGRVAPARGLVEKDLALDRAAQRLFKLGQSSFTPAAATTFCHFSISARMRLANSSGDSPPTCAV